MQNFCKNHLERDANNICSICSETFCDKCSSEVDAFCFCDEHKTIYLNSKWILVTIVSSSPSEPELGVELYRIKNELYSKKGIPSLISIKYDIEEDLIISKNYFYCLEKNKKYVSEEIKKGPNWALLMGEE